MVLRPFLRRKDNYFFCIKQIIVYFFCLQLVFLTYHPTLKKSHTLLKRCGTISRLPFGETLTSWQPETCGRRSPFTSGDEIHRKL